MLVVHLLAFLCIVIAFVCWAKAGFVVSFSACKMEGELWLFSAIMFTALFSAYSLVMGVAGVFSSAWFVLKLFLPAI